MNTTRATSVGACYAPYRRPTPGCVPPKHLMLVCPLEDLPQEEFDPALNTFRYNPAAINCRIDCRKYSVLLERLGVLPDLLRLELRGAGRVLDLEHLTRLTKLMELCIHGRGSYDLAAIGRLTSLSKLALDCAVKAFSADPEEWLAPLTNLTHLSLKQSTLHQPHFPASVLQVLAKRAVPLRVAVLHIHSFPDMAFVRTAFNVYAIALQGKICFRTGPVAELQWGHQWSRAVLRCDWRVQLSQCGVARLV